MISVSELNVSERHSSNRKLDDISHLQRFFSQRGGGSQTKDKIALRGGGEAY